jgi:hypothetical protein
MKHFNYRLIAIFFLGIIIGYIISNILPSLNTYIKTRIGKKPIPSEPVVCTMEVKQCPDGSWVGRVPPKCDFAPCPKQTKTPPIKAYKSVSL